MNDDAIDLLSSFITTASRIREWIIDHPSGNLIAPPPLSREYSDIIKRISALAAVTDNAINRLWFEAGQPYGHIAIFKRYLGMTPEQVSTYEQDLAAYEQELNDHAKD